MGRLLDRRCCVALLSLWSILGRVQYSRRFGIALAEFFLFLAFFNAWRVEHQKRTAIEAMRLRMVVVAVAPAGDNREGSIITVSGIITNESGPPSVADQFGARIKVAGHGDVPATILPRGMGNPVLTGGANVKVTLRESQYWPEAGVERPIETGGGRVGWLMLYFKDLSLEYVTANRATVVVSFCDVRGPSISRPSGRYSLQHHLGNVDAGRWVLQTHAVQSLHH